MGEKKRNLIWHVKRDKYLLLLMIPVFLYFLIFQYFPMYGVALAFQNYSPLKGVLGSTWVGFKWFEEFFHSFYFWRLIKNTFLISFYQLLWGFPIPIIFALLLNEIKNGRFKRTIQTISYLPHFISVVVIVGIMVIFLSPNDGIVNMAIVAMGGKPVSFMLEPPWFRALYVGSGVWQEFGWTSIIFIAALSSIDPQLYEAATIDGANRWKQLMHVTLPGLLPTAMILFILSVGSLMLVGHEKILLMYSPANYETSDVISTYVYRKGLISAQYSFATAVGLFNSIICFAFLYATNKISHRLTQISLW